MRLTWLSLVMVAGAVGCGPDENRVYIDRDRDGGGGGKTMANDSGEEMGPDAGNPLAPKVEILEPVPASDPNEDPILTEKSVKVVCSIKRSDMRLARDVNESSVKITMLHAEDRNLDKNGVVTAVSSEQFSAEFALDERRNGPVSFVCSAEDVGMPPTKALDRVDTLLDLGPTVRILDPGDDSRHALQKPVAVQFEVIPAPVTDDDDGAGVSLIELRVLDREFDFEADPDVPGRYTQNIDFSDRTRFPMAPSNGDIVVIATNSRQPEPVQRRAEVSVALDAEGPTITVMSPMHEQIVRGQVQLTAMITDPSGVQRDMVEGRVNGDSLVLKANDWDVSGDIYTAQFDTRAQVFEDLPMLTIDVTATDMVGNKKTAVLTVRLDNKPPLISLDPPYVRESIVEADKKRCSDPFDPVGLDAASDLSRVRRASLYRAMVDERTNSIEGGNAQWVAGVDEASMRLYARHDDDIPLLIDTNDDGTCDDINSDALDEDERPAVTRLSPIPVRGEPEYSVNADFTLAIHDVRDEGCNPTDMDRRPNTICGSLMTRTMHQTLVSKPPAIYAISPEADTSAPACQGETWALEPIVGEGWTCLAATVLDSIGNKGVSRPIRVCIDDERDPPPDCLDPVANPPPNCVDGCILPEDFQPNDIYYR